MFAAAPALLLLQLPALALAAKGRPALPHIFVLIADGAHRAVHPTPLASLPLTFFYHLREMLPQTSDGAPSAGTGGTPACHPRPKCRRRGWTPSRRAELAVGCSVASFRQTLLYFISDYPYRI